MLLHKGSKLVMIGDSITVCGRARPVGEGRDSALGNGYVKLVAAQLFARHPEAAIRVVNMGVSGDQTRHLKARWQQDAIGQHPDWLSIMIGINDVWRIFDSPYRKELHVSKEEYADNLDELVTSAQSRVRGIVLLAPYMIEPNRQDAMRQIMDEYGAAARDIAKKRGVIFADTQAAFDEALRHVHPYYLAWDRIHPETHGHMIIADTFLRAVEA